MYTAGRSQIDSALTLTKLLMRATLIGSMAIVLWSSLAALATASGAMPPFQLAAVTFAIGGLIGVASWPFRRGAAGSLRQPPVVWALGVAGLFGYHALYFFALRLAPPAEASLVNYLWPLLVVVFAALLPGERLYLHHIGGTVLGLTGTVLLMVGKGHVALDARALAGCAAAASAAIVWASYSVLSRRFASVPSDTVAGFCLATAALATTAHLLFEATVWPATMMQWCAIVALGLGPVGLAFYVWDHGMKRGDIKVLGALSYATPVLSTLILIVTGYAEASATLGVSCLFIVSGALLASKDLLVGREPGKLV